MKNIILAAGYATRLYPLTENFPKPLLKIGESTILGRILDDVDRFPEIDEHIIVTNHKFAHIFEQWVADQHYSKPIRIIDDGTETNDTRLGAVCDLLLALRECEVNDDIMVLAADNILDFSFRGFVDAFKESGKSTIMCHHEPEIYKLQRTGVIEVDPEMRVLQMQEKPEVPVSHWAVPPILYLFARRPAPDSRMSGAWLRPRCAGQPGSLSMRSDRCTCLSDARFALRHRITRHLRRSQATLFLNFCAQRVTSGSLNKTQKQ